MSLHRRADRIGKVTLLPGRFAAKRFLAKVIVVGVTVLGSAVILWTDQTSDALLRVASFPDAVVQVLFWGFPGMVVYLLLCRRWLGIAAGGVSLAGLTFLEWSQAAKDVHSTASVGPGFVGWILIPGLLATGVVVSWLVHPTPAPAGEVPHLHQ